MLYIVDSAQSSKAMTSQTGEYQTVPMSLSNYVLSGAGVMVALHLGDKKIFTKSSQLPHLNSLSDLSLALAQPSRQTREGKYKSVSPRWRGLGNLLIALTLGSTGGRLKWYEGRSTTQLPTTETNIRGLTLIMVHAPRSTSATVYSPIHGDDRLKVRGPGS